MYSKVVGVLIGTEGGFAHIECYERWLKEDWMFDHNSELTDEEKTKILQSLENRPIWEHLEVMEQYTEVYPFCEHEAPEQGEWCVLCGEEITLPWCKECGEPVDYTGTRTLNDRFLCHEHMIEQRNKDYIKALTEYTQELELKSIKLWNKSQNNSKLNKEIQEKLDLLEEIEQNGPLNI